MQLVFIRWTSQIKLIFSCGTPKKKKKKDMECPFWQLLRFSGLFAIQHDTLDCLSMINCPSKDEWVSYRNTSAHYKGTGGGPQSGKHEWTFRFKVLTDSVSHPWNSSEPQAAAWYTGVKNKLKTFTLNPEDQRNPTNRTTDSVSKCQGHEGKMILISIQTRTTQYLRLWDKTTTAHLLRIPNKLPLLIW